MTLYKVHTQLLTFLAHLVGPDTCLYLADVTLVQQHHTKAALAYTAADAERQFVVHQFLVEVESKSLFLAFNLQLTNQRLRVNTDTH